jgi:hypothetical protein
MQTPLRPAAAAALALFALAGCAREAQTPPSDDAARPAAAGEGGYLVTPEITQALRAPDGGVSLAGRAAPGSMVRLASPEGEAFYAPAGPDGAWRLTLPPIARARMFAMAADLRGRPVHAQGALLALPAPAVPALMVRAGYGAVAPGQPGAPPAILALDYDPAGFAAVAGLAAPRAPVRLSLDGAMAGETRTDALGRFSILAANHALAPGAHAVAVDGPGGRREVTAFITAAQPLSQPYHGERLAGAWRVDWTPPGAEGAVQTTLVFDPLGQGV